MQRPHPIEPQVLLSHAHWMRALARSLVHDSSSADDVVQESFSVALSRPPNADRPLHAWLSRVVRNVATNLRRGEQRRTQRQLRRGAPEQASDPAATIERLDTQRLVLELVSELDEPARSTIVLAFFEGLNSPQIAQRMGVSDATVRWRMQKALAELRARLERKFGSREAWSAVLLPFANSFQLTTTATAASAVTAGALIMGAVSKIVVAAAAVAIASVAVWFALDRGEPVVQTAEAATTRSQTGGELVEPLADAAAGRETRANEPGSSALETVPAPTSVVTSLTEVGVGVRVRFVDASGLPRDGVSFRVNPEDFWAISDKSKSSTISDAAGHAQLSFAIPQTLRDPNLEFVASRAGCATLTLHATLVHGVVVDLGEVVLDREAHLQGLVHDAQGIGLAEASVGLTSEDLGDRGPGDLRRFGPREQGTLMLTRSDASGRFELRGVPAGEWRLWGHREGLGFGVSETLVVKAGDERVGVDLEVPALLSTDTVTGLVLDPEGKPAAEVQVAFHWSTPGASGFNSSLSKEDGSFEVLLNAEVPGMLSADDTKQRWASATRDDVAPGARGIVLRLASLGISQAEASRLARLRVLGPMNEPVSGVKITLLEQQRHGGFLGNQLTPREIEAGLFEFALPGAAFELKVSAQGYVDGALDNQGMPMEPERVPAELSITLELAPLLPVRVTSAGIPVASALVEAMSEIPQGKSILCNGFPCVLDPRVQASAITGLDGICTIALQGDAPVYLRCAAPGFAATTIGPIRVESAAVPIEIELKLGGAIEGRVLSKDGTPVVGTIVGATCGDGHPLTMLSGLDGAFRFEGLSVSKWLVIEREEQITGMPTTETSFREQRIDWSCEVHSGRTTRFDLILDR